MKRIMTILLTANLLLAGIGIYGRTVQAEEKSTAIQVSYEPETEADFHTLTLSVSGGGRVMDGTQVITKGILTYALQEGAQKTFLVEPYKGYRLQSIQYEADGNSQNLTKKMSGQRVSVRMGKSDSHLFVVFEKVSTQKGNIDSVPIGTVKTGDASNIWIYLCLISTALVVCVGIIRIKRKRSEKN